MDDALLAELLGIETEKPQVAKKLRRRSIHFPDLQGCTIVKFSEKTLTCNSRGCGSPTAYRLRTIPYCSRHLIIILVRELENLIQSEKTREWMLSDLPNEGGVSVSLESSQSNEAPPVGNDGAADTPLLKPRTLDL